MLGVFSIDLNKALIYPNPVESILNIAAAQGGESVILNSSGKELMRFSDASKDVTQLPEGLYYLMVRRESGSITIGKFIKK